MPRIEPSSTFMTTKALGRPVLAIADSPAAWIFLSRVSFRLSPAFGSTRDSSRPRGSPDAVDLDADGAVAAAEDRVVLELEAGRADPVARLEALVGGLLELVRTDLADVAEQVGAERPVRVVADVDLRGGDAGELVLALARGSRRDPSSTSCWRVTGFAGSSFVCRRISCLTLS